MTPTKSTFAAIAIAVLGGCIFFFYPRQAGQPPEGPPQPHKVTLKWDKAARATGYNVYRRPYLTSGYVKLGASTTTTYEDASVQSAKRYCYQVTAVDSKTRESAPSRECCITVPRP